MRLFEEYPRPWRVEERVHETTVLDANNNEVMCQTSYTGDGDEIRLTTEQMMEMAGIINGEMIGSSKPVIATIPDEKRKPTIIHIRPKNS